MWFLNFIPDAWLHWFIHGILVLGVLLSVVGFIAKNIPFVSQYGIIVKALGGLLFIAGVYFEGGYGVEMSWRERANSLQAKLDVAQKESDDLKDKLQNKSEKNTIIITQKVTENAKQIEQKREVINTGCTINDDAWLLYNRAVAPKLPVSSGQPAAASR